MEEKISVTIKAGTGFDVPWIVLKAASLEDMANDVRQAQELLQEVSYLAKQFEEVYKSTPANAGELVKQVLGATQVSIEPVSAPPIPQPAAAAPAPWDVPAPAVAPMPWETGVPVAPPAPSTPSIKFPFLQKDETVGSPYMRRRAYMNWFYENRNKLTFNQDTKAYDFAGPLTPEQYAMAQRAGDVGGVFSG